MTITLVSCQDCGAAGKRLWARGSDGLRICFDCFHVTAKQPRPHPTPPAAAAIPRPRGAHTSHPFLPEQAIDWGYRPHCQVCRGERYAPLHREAL